jgi:hypothetical protein
VPDGSLVPLFDRYKNDPRAEARLTAAVENLPRLVGSQSRTRRLPAFLKLINDRISTNLSQLVECPEHGPAPAAETLGVEESI